MRTERAADVAIIGAGPYGLSAAAHLLRADLEVLVFGQPMSFWRLHMPDGMFLRSSPRASNISDPDRRLTLARYREQRGMPTRNPLPLIDFLGYAEWFQEQIGLVVDTRRVTRVDRTATGFSLLLEDGEAVSVPRVVVAGGIAPFARRPPAFRELREPLVLHSVDIRETGPFEGRRVIVIGAGQSALETAALLHEARSDVEIIARAQRVVWIPSPEERGVRRRIDRLAYAPTEVGPRGLSWVAALPDVFRRLPEALRAQIGPVCIAPMGAYWLRPRLRGVPLALGRGAVAVSPENGRVTLKLDDGGKREADHVVLATGFQVDVARYDFLAADLVASLRLADGSPVLGTGLESSVPGMHFVGAAAAHTFGPVMRFVIGTAYAAPALTRTILRRPPLPVVRAW
jgi:cation diffusion facilitator CzcD-associated flavoprotein CzcO